MTETADPVEPRLPRWLWPDWKRRRKSLKRWAWVIVVLTYVALAFAYALPVDFRNTSRGYVWCAWAAQLIRTGEFHAGLLVALIAVAALFRRRWILLTAAVPIVLFALGPSAYLYLPRGTVAHSGKPLRVFSANLLMVNTDTEGIIGEIKAADADVVLLQEVTEDWERALVSGIGSRYRHRICIPQDDSFGIAIYSKSPFVGRPVDNLHLGDWPLPQIRAVIRHEGREVALYNIHLLPPRRFDYTVQHRLEFSDLLGMLQKESMPVIMTGDFNCTETTSQAWALKRAGFGDAHEIAGYGRGSTWCVTGFMRYLPGIRLDHIYLSPQLTTVWCRTGQGRGSDHRPLVAEVAFR